MNINFKDNNIFNKFLKSKNMELLLNKLNFNITSDNLENIKNIVKFEFISKNKIIFKENQKTNLKFYYIIKGKVGISKILKKELKYNKKKVSINNFNFGYHFKSLNDNNCFGEMALLNYEHKRTATCFTLEDTYFAIVSKENFEKLIKQNLIIEYNIKKKLFRSSFNVNLTNYFLELMITMSTKNIYKKNNIILYKNDFINTLYFICDGIIEFYDKFNNIYDKQSNNLVKLKFINKNIYQKELLKYEYFGEDIFFEDKPKSKFFIKIKSSEAIIYSLSIDKINVFPELKKFFFNYFNKFKKQKNYYIPKNKSRYINSILQLNKTHTKNKNINSNKLDKFLLKNNKYLKLSKQIKNKKFFHPSLNSISEIKKNNNMPKYKENKFLKSYLKEKRRKNISFVSILNKDLNKEYINIIKN